MSLQAAEQPGDVRDLAVARRGSVVRRDQVDPGLHQQLEVVELLGQRERPFGAHHLLLAGRQRVGDAQRLLDVGNSRHQVTPRVVPRRLPGMGLGYGDPIQIES